MAALIPSEKQAEAVRLFARGHGREAVSQMTGVPRTTVRSIVLRHGMAEIKTTTWTEDETDELKSLIKTPGITCRQIGRLLGKSQGAVKGRMARLGLTIKPVREVVERPPAMQEREYVAALRAEGGFPVGTADRGWVYPVLEWAL